MVRHIKVSYRIVFFFGIWWLTDSQPLELEEYIVSLLKDLSFLQNISPNQEHGVILKSFSILQTVSLANGRFTNGEVLRHFQDFTVVHLLLCRWLYSIQANSMASLGRPCTSKLSRNKTISSQICLVYFTSIPCARDGHCDTKKPSFFTQSNDCPSFT